MLAEIVYDGELSGSAYFILFAMGILVIGGLSWCFFRAMIATNHEGDEQHPDEI